MAFLVEQPSKSEGVSSPAGRTLYEVKYSELYFSSLKQGEAMSKLVCRVAKFKGGQLYGMDIHIQRKTENHSNKDIDVSRSKLNYELVNGFQNEHYFTAVKKRIDDGYLGQKALRKDATLACGILISSDKNFFDGLTEEQEKNFFKNAYEYLCQKYGTENIISAKVHKDETTPHLHAIVVPLTKDGRLSAKELFDRKALLSLQADLPKKLNQSGFNINRGESSNKKHLETAEFKKIRDENKVVVEINPCDVEPRIIKDGIFKKEVEAPEQIAVRLNQKYINPLTNEISDLRTELAIIQNQEKRIKHAKAFAKNREDEFSELYYAVKKFGSKHVDNVLNKLREVVKFLNDEKAQQDKMAEQQKAKDLEKNHSENLLKIYGGYPDLSEIIDLGKAPYNMKEDGKPSFYVLVKNLVTKTIQDFWGMEYKDLNLKRGDIMRVKGDKIERAERIQFKARKGIGMP